MTQNKIIQCSKCENVERYITEDDAIENGCGGVVGTINQKPINIMLCSECYSPKTLNKELMKWADENNIQLRTKKLKNEGKKK